MTKSTRDIPANEGSTIADRLKAARNDADLTRKALAEATGIPYSTLEKYERGDMDPNTTRLQMICDHLNVSVSWVMNGNEHDKGTEASKTAETLPSANVADTSTAAPSEAFLNNNHDEDEASTPSNDNSPEHNVSKMLNDLDVMANDGFKGFQRAALALVADISGTLKRLEPDALLGLALDRGLQEDDEYLDVDGIKDLFSEDLDEGQKYCGEIESRILDTAILRLDLYTLERSPLVAIADKFEEEYELARPRLIGLSWGGYMDFVPIIRPYLWKLAYISEGNDLTDQNEFPKREMGAEASNEDDASFLGH